MFITYAIMPGNTTITGIINFRKAANAIPFWPSLKLLAANVLCIMYWLNPKITDAEYKSIREYKSIYFDLQLKVEYHT